MRFATSLATFLALVAPLAAHPIQGEATANASSGQTLRVVLDSCPTLLDEEVDEAAIYQSYAEISAPGNGSPSIIVRRVYIVDVSASSAALQAGFDEDTNGDGIVGTRLDAALQGLIDENQWIALNSDFVGYWCNASGDGYSYSVIAFAENAAFADLSSSPGVSTRGGADELPTVLRNLRSEGTGPEIGVHTPLELSGPPNLAAALDLCLQAFATESTSTVYEVVVLGCSDVGSDVRWADELAALQSTYQVRFQCHEVGSTNSPWTAVASGTPSGFFVQPLPGLVTFDRHIVRWNGQVRYSFGSLGGAWWRWGVNDFTGTPNQGDTTTDFWGDFRTDDWPTGTTLVEVEARANDGTSVTFQKQLVKYGRRIEAPAHEDRVLEAPFTGFGDSLAYDGTTLLVPGTTEGIAIALRLDAANDWTIDGLLVSGPLGTSTLNGSPLSLEGSRAVLGVPSRSAVHVFEDSSDPIWNEVAVLEPASPSVSSGFGRAVDSSGVWIAVGAPTGAGSSSSDGRVHIFERSPGGTWSETAILVDPLGSNGDEFGRTVRVAGDRIFVGAPGRARSGLAGVGAVHVFVHDPVSGWQFVESVVAPNDESFAAFGAALDVSGDTLVVGAPGGGPASAPYVGAGPTGRAYVYELQSSGSFTLSQELAWADARPLDGFGSKVAIEGDRIAVLAPGPIEQNPFGPHPWGHAVIFERVGDAWWRHVVNCKSSIGRPLEGGLALGGDRLIVGGESSSAPLHDFSLGRLYHGSPALSVTAGGEQTLLVRTDPSSAGYIFLFAGSLTGTTSGFVEPFGGLHVDVDFDAYTIFLLEQLGAGLVVPWFGLLDTEGDADAVFRLPRLTSPAFVGRSIFHAALVLDPTTFSSKLSTKAVRLDLTE